MDFTRTPDNNTKLERFLSTERLKSYYDATKNCLDSALSLYEYNARLSEAFYIPLQCFEISFRNAINHQLSDSYGADWIFTQRPPFAQNTRQSVKKAINELQRRKGKSLTAGHIVAELKLAFWVSLLARRYDSTLWRQSLYRAFLVGGSKSRTVIHGRANALRRFRNRVAHHEPIFNRDTEKTHQEIIEIIGWVCADTAKWTDSQSRFQEVFKTHPFP